VAQFLIKIIVLSTALKFEVAIHTYGRTFSLYSIIGLAAQKHYCYWNSKKNYYEIVFVSLIISKQSVIL